MTFENLEIVVQEAEMPFETGTRGVVFEGMSTALGFFDEFAVGDAGSRPSLWEMVGVELVYFAMSGVAARDDVFAVFAAFLALMHDAAVRVNTLHERKIAHTACVVRGNLGSRDLFVHYAFQTAKYACFKMLRHIV